MFFAGWLVAAGQGRELWAVARTPRIRRRLLVSAGLVAINWFVFFYAIIVDRVLDVSLGYFINPLVSVALGRVFLGETLRRLQWVAVIAAAGGIAVVAVAAGGLPWISLTLALSFGAYGLLRKTVDVPPLAGSTFETLLLLPLAFGFLMWLGDDGYILGGGVSLTDLIILGAGPATAIPLLLFVNAARRLRLTTLGFLQYLAPSLHFVLAAAVFGEPTPAPRLAAFGLVWAALGLFSYDAWRGRAAARAQA